MAIEKFQKSESLTLHETPKEAMPASTEVVIDTEKEETTSEEVTTSFTEECHTFVIKVNISEVELLLLLLLLLLLFYIFKIIIENVIFKSLQVEIYEIS